MTTPKADALDALAQIRTALESPEPLTGLRLRLLRETVDYTENIIEWGRGLRGAGRGNETTPTQGEEPMSDLVKYQAPDVMTLGAVLAKSGYFQDARDAAQAVVKVLAGQELGFGPIASMTGIYIVKGRVSLSANLIAASVKRGKYNYRVTELSDTACKITFYEGKEAVGESAFTMDDAKAAGLAFGENYKKFPRNMLFARAMSNGAKWYCA